MTKTGQPSRRRRTLDLVAIVTMFVAGVGQLIAIAIASRGHVTIDFALVLLGASALSVAAFVAAFRY